MVRIDENTLYTRSDLEGLLEPHGVNVDSFIGKLRPRRVFKMLYRGADLLEAWDRAPELKDPIPTPAHKHNGGRKRGMGKNLVAGVFTAEEYDRAVRSEKSG